MGNSKSHLTSEDANEYPFVGREKDISTIHEYLKSNRLIQIHGLQEIGTSRVMKQVMKSCPSETKCLYKDFSLDADSFGTADILNLLVKLQGEVHQSCENGVEARGKLDFKDALNAFMRDATEHCKDVVLFLDNVDAVKNKDFKEYLLDFLHAVVKGAPSLKVVFTTVQVLRMTTKGYVSHRLTKMNNKEIKQLFDAILQSKRKVILCNDDEDNDDDDDYCENGDNINDILDDLSSEENKKFIDVLIKLCFGLPKLAMMTVSLLTDYDGLLEPKDLIVLIVEDNLNTLSPDCYPSQDRADTYKEAIEELITSRKELLYQVNREMDVDNSASLKTVITCVPDAKSDAHAKQAATPLLDNHMMSYNKKKKEFVMWPILRDCCLVLDTLAKEDKALHDGLKKARLKLTKLDVPDDVATSREFEKFLASLDKSCSNSQPQDCREPINMGGATEETKVNIDYPLPYSAENLQCQGEKEIDRNINGATNDLSLCSFSGPPALSYRNLSSDDMDGNMSSVEDNIEMMNRDNQEANGTHVKPRVSDKLGERNKKREHDEEPTQTTNADDGTLSNTFVERKHADNEIRKSEILPCGTEITGTPTGNESFGNELTGTGWKTKSSDRNDIGQLEFDHQEEGFMNSGNENGFIASMMPDNEVKPKHPPITVNGQEDRLKDDLLLKLNLGMEDFPTKEKTLNDSD